MLLWDHKDVSLGKRIDVEIGEDEIVLVDLEARDLPGGYGAEYAVVLHAVYYPINARGCQRAAAAKRVAKAYGNAGR